MLDDLDQYTFGKSKNQIKWLHLSASNIHRLLNGVFTTFGNLNELYLNSNKIFLIENGVFSPLVSLQVLSMSNNRLTSIPSTYQLGISPNLRLLTLSNNYFIHLYKDNFVGYEHLTQLSLTYVGTKKINTDAFDHLKNITLLKLTHNSIGILPSRLFQPMGNLVRLDLMNNNIRYIKNDSFGFLVHLRILKLSGNIQLGIHPIGTAFNGLSGLKVLMFNGCNLQNVDSNIYDNLTELETLSMSKSQITHWNTELFRPLIKLKILYMINNKLVTVNARSFQYLKNLMELYLSQNLFACNCDLLWFLDWMKSGPVFINSESIDSYICSSPQNLKSKSLFDINFLFKDCEDHWNTVFIGSVCFTTIVTVAIGTIVFKYRWYLRYWIFLIRTRGRQYQRLANDPDYLYDAFVCYNNNNRTWVIEKLLPELEYKRGLHLCLHDRDWLAGPDIVDNIMDSIEQSRKTVLVLSNHFARSQWCQFEMTMAQHKLVDDNIDVLVLIVLEDIDPMLTSARLR